MRVREIGECIGVTERAAQTAVNDLVEAGYLRRFREGRRNRYEVQPDVQMRHALLRTHSAGELLAVLVPDDEVHAADPTA
jgi:DNA-binding transcriptional regulator PaaX